MADETISLISLGIGGAALLLSMLQEIRHRRLDRHELRLSAGIAHDRVGLRMVNAGRRDIRVSAIYREFLKGQAEEVLYPTGSEVLPRTLPPSDEHWADVCGVDAFGEEAEPRIVGMFAEDSLGGRWALAHPDFLRVQREAREVSRKRREAQAARDRASLRKHLDGVLRDTETTNEAPKS